MYYYVQLNEDDTVKAISMVSVKMEGRNIVEIDGKKLDPKKRRELISKRYNRETGEFEDVK